MMQKGIGRSGPASRFSFGIRALFTIIMLVAVPVALHAQAYYGSIVGNVTDSQGAAVVGAKVTATANGTDVKSTTTTSGQGTFSLAQLAVGTYVVRINAPGFKEFVSNGVEVHISTNTSVNATLTLGAVSEKVTVQADEVQVETTSASIGEVITGQQVRELPLNSENFVSLTQLSPGVNAAASFDGVGKGLEGGVNFSVNGNPYTNNLFLVDGVNNNDVGSGRTILVYPSIDTIAEFKMIRNSYGPEYGQASGAIISITTKSGQNQFHGGFFYSGRNDKLDANDWESNHLNVGKATTSAVRSRRTSCLCGGTRNGTRTSTAAPLVFAFRHWPSKTAISALTAPMAATAPTARRSVVSTNAAPRFRALHPRHQVAPRSMPRCRPMKAQPRR
jgi:hypothetical protein